MEKVVKGQPILSLGGKDYGFVGENELKSTTSILSQNEGGFKFGAYVNIHSSIVTLTSL
jgi:hypothetical protein